MPSVPRVLSQWRSCALALEAVAPPAPPVATVPPPPRVGRVAHAFRVTKLTRLATVRARFNMAPPSMNLGVDAHTGRTADLSRKRGCLLSAASRLPASDGGDRRPQRRPRPPHTGGRL